MNYIFRGTSGKWFPVNFAGFWTIRDGNYYQSKDVLNEEDCAKAPANALLASKAPEMSEMLRKVLDLSPLLRYSGIIQAEHIGEAEAVGNLLNSIEQLLKEATEL